VFNGLENLGEILGFTLVRGVFDSFGFHRRIDVWVLMFGFRGVYAAAAIVSGCACFGASQASSTSRMARAAFTLCV
jgi:hypothetical protein